MGTTPGGANKEAVFVSMDLAITDTADHYSDVSDCREASQVTLLYNNSLDQDVDMQLVGSDTEDFTDEYDIGTPTTVAAGSKDYETLTDFWPFLRVKATAGVAPSSGTAKIVVCKQLG